MTMKTNYFNFLNYKSILFLAKDKQLINKVESLVIPRINNFKTSSFLPEINSLSSYDLVIVDADYFSTEHINITFIECNISIPIIYIVSELNEKKFDLLQNLYVKNILIKNLHLNEIYMYIFLVLKEIRKVDLSYGFYYCFENNELLFNNNIVHLTNLETKVLDLLIKNKNKVISNNEIMERVWKEKRCTIFSIRNIIKKIRDKSFKKIIRNISNKGYIIDIY